MAFDIPTLKAAPHCSGILNIKQLGWNRIVNGDTFSVSIDVNTLFTALSVTYKVNGPNTLDGYEIIDIYTEIVFNNVTYQVTRVYFNLYAQMTPMFCIGPKGGNSSDWNCLIQIGNSFGIPFFNHAGALPNYPEKCDCSTDVGQLPSCNQFNFLSGVMLYDVTKNVSATRHYSPEAIPFLPILEFFYIPPLQSALTANEYSYYPAWTAMLGQGHSFFQKTSWRRSIYDFSKTRSFGTGAFIAFQSLSLDDWGISADKYQLKNGACSDTMTSPQFANLASNPW